MMTKRNKRHEKGDHGNWLKTKYITRISNQVKENIGIHLSHFRNPKKQHKIWSNIIKTKENNTKDSL
jgi:hypothetical protein